MLLNIPSIFKTRFKKINRLCTTWKASFLEEFDLGNHYLKCFKNMCFDLWGGGSFQRRKNPTVLLCIF